MVKQHIIHKVCNIAAYGNVTKAKVAAIAFAKTGQIITYAHNRKVCFNTRQLSQHAEEVLIYKLNRIKAFNRFKNISILVIRITSNGLAIAKPCQKCMKLLNQYKINIFYTDLNGCINCL